MKILQVTIEVEEVHVCYLKSEHEFLEIYKLFVKTTFMEKTLKKNAHVESKNDYVNGVCKSAYNQKIKQCRKF
jgi:hypothetical protein